MTTDPIMGQAIQLLPWAFPAAYGMLSVALLLACYRLFAGGSVFDRIVALDVIAGIVLCSAAVFAIETGSRFFLDISLAIAVITFLGSVAFARHLDRSAGSEEQRDEIL